MSYTFKTVKKPGSNAGAGQSVNPNVILIKASDIIFMPERDKTDRVDIEGNIVLKEGAEAFRIYLTPSTHKKTLSTEGDDDAKGFAQTYEGWHPGDEREVNAFAQNALNEGFVAIMINCQGNYRRMYGSTCNPLVCTPSMEGTNEKTGWTFTFAQQIREGLVPAFYYGALPDTSPAKVSGAAITFEKAKGAVYQTEPSATATALTLSNTDFEHGEVVSIAGSGGEGAYELKSGENVMLENGTTWLALANSVINLKVFDTGGKVVFIETSRS